MLPARINRIAIRFVIVSCGLVTLNACVGPAPVMDSGPEAPLDVSHIPNAVPRVEPRTSAGNKSPYTVLGKTYQVMASADNYRERGAASWYGRKFHGAKTSNGEIYNMYGMTAAHKSLPIPTFVQVRNLDNGKEVIVRVNDRGPFHGDRIIDLTYAAAKKLGFVDKGTAQVEVIAIDPVAWASEQGAEKNGETSGPALAVSGVERPAPAPEQSEGYQLPEKTFLQAGAFGSRESATALQEKLVNFTSLPVFVTPVDALQKLFRVRIGPITDNFELLNLKQRIQQLNLGIPHIVRE